MWYMWHIGAWAQWWTPFYRQQIQMPFVGATFYMFDSNSIEVSSQDPIDNIGIIGSGKDLASNRGPSQ